MRLSRLFLFRPASVPILAAVLIGAVACDSVVSGKSTRTDGTGGGGDLGGAPGSGGSASGGESATGGVSAGVGGESSVGAGGVAPGDGGSGSGGEPGAGGGLGMGGVGSGGDGSGGDAAGGSPGIVYGVAKQSCAGEVGDECEGVSCCTSIPVPGGEFEWGRSEVMGVADYFPGGDANELTAGSVRISAFELDRFEVTVGRFRKFLEVYDGSQPPNGAAAHPSEPASGWVRIWNVPPSREAFVENIKCFDVETWTDEEGENEVLPMNCLSWYESFLFCAWDGGRLPTEAEWEYAASGGGQERLYPWEESAINCGHASRSTCSSPGITPVGTYPAGQGRFGHDDLGGNMLEWVLDAWAPDFYSQTSTTEDPMNLSSDPAYRVFRSSWVHDDEVGFRNARRQSGEADLRGGGHGVRCAR